LAIKDVAERTGIAAGTIRMWESRYGVPVPERTAAGYRVYSSADVELLNRAMSYRRRGLSVPAALERAKAAGGPTDRPSIYGAIASGETPVKPQVLRKRTLLGISRAIEDETLARAAGPVVFGAFQQVKNYRAVQHRYTRLAANADAAAVFADFPAAARPPGACAEIPIAPEDALGNEWAVVVDAPGYAACLLAWEQPRTVEEAAHGRDFDRRFEALWTMDPTVVRRAALVCCALVRRTEPALGEEIEQVLAERSLAVESPAPALTALTNRIVGYLER
jgi:DICT domain-containing protein